MKVYNFKEFLNEEIKKENGQILLKQILTDIKFSCENDWFNRDGLQIENCEIEDDNLIAFVNDNTLLWKFIFTEDDVIGSESLTKSVKMFIYVYDNDTTDLLSEKSPITIKIGDLNYKMIKELMRNIKLKFNKHVNDLTDNIYKM
jgi:hypothetical protein